MDWTETIFIIVVVLAATGGLMICWLRSDIISLREEMRQLRGDTRSDMKRLRDDMQNDIQRQRS
ncbi:MAG: hypothetical protein OXG60_19800 [Chloroflexi bacterium]|nr:hypothetical protein [Chloroflexota bacterium]